MQSLALMSDQIISINKQEQKLVVKFRLQNKIQQEYKTMASLLPALLVRVLGLGAAAVVVAGGTAPAEDAVCGEEGERDEAGERDGVQRQGRRGPGAEAAEVGAHLAPRHVPVAAKLGREAGLTIGNYLGRVTRILTKVSGTRNVKPCHMHSHTSSRNDEARNGKYVSWYVT